MRLAIAQVWHETNTFSPIPTGLAEFEQGGLYVGNGIRDRMPGLGEVGAFLAAAEERGDVDVIPILRAWAMPGGRVTADMLADLESRLTRGLRESLPVDGVLLSLHGASAAEGEDDVEGRLLAAVRSIVGGEVPVVVTLDHHANVTRRMVDSVDALVAYRTLPHDPYETGLRAAELLFGILDGQTRPTMAWRKIPMLAPADRGRTSEWPMSEVYGLARDIERRPGVLSASHFIVMPWLDVPDVGWSALVVTGGNVDLAERYADELASTAWDLRAEFWDVQRLSPADAIRRAMEAERGPVIICDASDSALSGAPGDGTCLLREMLRQGITCRALVPIVDPRVVDEAINAGVGSRISTRVGGSLDPVFGAPVEVTGRVAGIAREGMRFPIGQLGFSDMGRSVLLQVGSISLVVSEFRGIGGAHPDIYRRFGVEPAEAGIIVVKTYFHYEDFAPLYTDAFRVDCPGLSGWDLRTFPWVHATRPIYPLDEGVEWRPERH